MSENRNRYSSAPLQNMKQVQRQAKAAKAPKRTRTPAPTSSSMPVGGSRVRSFTGLQLMLMIILPVLFIVSLFVRSNMLYLIFAAASVLCLMATWLFSAFVPNARATLTIIHIAMVLVVLFAVLISPPATVPEDKTNTNDLQSIFDKESSASMVAMLSAQQAATGPTATPNPGHASFAQQRLEMFMSAWSNIDYAAMATYCVPSWVALQSDPQTAMFHIRANRSIVSYEILDVTGNDSDQTRTINMLVVIDKSNGNPPQTHRFQVLMVRVNNEWYVDPNSLGSLGIVQTEEEIAAQAIATIVPTATPDPNMVLYYNPNGGRLYHRDPNCNSLLPEYLPLTASFYYSDLGSSQFSSLIPCGTCRAPAR